MKMISKYIFQSIERKKKKWLRNYMLLRFLSKRQNVLTYLNKNFLDCSLSMFPNSSDNMMEEIHLDALTNIGKKFN